MNINAYSSALSIPTYPGPTRPTGTRAPDQSQTGGQPTQTASTPTENAVPNTGLLNTVV